MHEKIIILDFGSPTTQLIGRKIRELNTYCEIVPYHKFPSDEANIKGVVLSGSPYRIGDDNAFKINIEPIRKKYPVLGICYGAQLICEQSGGKLTSSPSLEDGRAHLSNIDLEDALMKGVRTGSQIWVSNGESIAGLPTSFKPVASSENMDVAAYRVEGEKTWGVMFYPEVFNTEQGVQIIDNFLQICECRKDWTAASFIESTVAELNRQIGNDKVILALSGGVDSTVTAVLLNKSIGKNLSCIFVDHGLLRKNEFENVLRDYEHLGLNVKGVDAKEKFYSALAGVTDPEQKRKIIGKGFIDVFEDEAKNIKGIKWLGQGTIYPDVIESLSVTGKVIKSHHNVGGLPEKMNLKLVEPLRLLFKDEVRMVGKELGINSQLLGRHPFPGPGLGVRILGAITPEKVHILQEADDIFISMLREWGLYNKVWQAGAILLSVNAVGIVGDERTYENAVALRAVTSIDAMTADWATLPYDFLAKVSNEIIHKVQGVNRVVYDISAKPPATIEWE
ncbi:MAG: glutamine-hydrolyzing GMP synthase [Tannerella sp.]|jgi:GMP synthase (glutamine-hydrolysing)|nr:glutamine-hydrolyzing GMP synthase [Tannerella sp.]